MTNFTKLKDDFLKLPYKRKLAKIKEILSTLSKKSPFFKDLNDHYKNKNIQENALDAIYSFIMGVAEQQYQ